MRRRPTKWNELLDEYLFTMRMRREPFRHIASVLGVSLDGAVNRFKRICYSRGVNPHFRAHRRAR